jgi:hypothetical protein
MKFTTIDRATAKALRTILSAAIEEALEGTGVAAEVGRITFAGNTAAVKVQASIIDPDSGRVMTREAKDFERLAVAWGITSKKLGDRFESRGTVYEITGLNTRAPKFPVQGIRVKDGRSFKFPVSMVEWANRG